ncbi:hypothetical protein [Streptacidiphilus neutrinimicus]|uniref:hypothetical protein n=1 Tax=Streptacidiphilus neutrinimicus TaxID=105420 RepID=UPI0005A94E32|nr:hypothetical protein [Streptacidiphilus neutrinimicus]
MTGQVRLPDAVARPRAGRPAADVRRALQLALAALWLLDGMLQLQPVMFTKTFATQVIAPAAQGEPGPVAVPVLWAAALIGHHPVLLDAVFAFGQLLLGLGIAWRPTVRVALAASVAWSLAVWWLGEGLGGVLTGLAGALSGAPGAVVLYALLAVLVWPTGRDGPSQAVRAVGVTAARALWLLLWGGLAILAVQPAETAPQYLHDSIAGMAPGQPAWLGSVVDHAAALTAHRGAAASVVLAAVLAAVAVAVLLPASAQRVLIALAVVVAVVVWVVGEALGGLLGGQATDPNSGPLLALVALAYWPGGSSAPLTAGAPGSGGRAGT